MKIIKVILSPEGGSNIEIVSFVLDIIHHKDYNKKFGYRNK